MLYKIIDLLGLIVITFLLGLYSAKQFKYGGDVSIMEWGIAYVFFSFMIYRNLVNYGTTNG